MFVAKRQQLERRFREHAAAEPAKNAPSQELLTIGLISARLRGRGGAEQLGAVGPGRGGS